jgi:Fic family protein
MEARLFELDAKTESLRAKIGSFPEKLRTDYESKLDVSWIFHDNALEGVVLSYSELKAAIDQRIISDVSLIPMYQEVKNHKLAVEFIRKLYAMVTPDAVAKGCPYRKENPLHRLYYHEITPPEKIPYKMRKLAEWLESSEFAGLHTIVKGVKIQLRLLQAYPWTQNSGKVARLLTNYLLLQNGYLPAVVHSIDRQRYYEVLRHENDGLMTLILESLENSIDTTSRFFDELSGLRVRCAS